MARWQGTWLNGLGSTGEEAGQRPDGWPGRSLGLPPEGDGSVAGTGRRALAFLVDALASGLVAAPFFSDPTDSRRGLAGVGVLAVMNILLVSLTGRTFGMRLLGLRVAPVRALSQVPGFLSACVRTALLLLLLPALVTDREGRGLHDKAAGTLVLRVRRQSSRTA